MTAAPSPVLDRIRIGSAPDSWGVWFPDDPQQVPWQRFLDEVAQSGYQWIELGPYGYLPTDPARLTDETARRGLTVSAGTVFTALHRGSAVWDATWEHVSQVAELTKAMGARHLVVIPEFWRDPTSGERTESDTLNAGQFSDLCSGMERLGRQVRETFGLDIVKLIETFGERIGYLHLKQVDPEILADVVANEVPFGPAVKRGVMCEPPSGVPELGPVLAAAQKLGTDIFAIVEPDMYPCPPDQPLPIAQRTRRFLSSCGA
jgi:inosose dehydratase